MFSRNALGIPDATGHSLRLHGARRLLLAVLHEAIATFQRHAGARNRRGRTAFTQAEAWFASEDTESVFAFVSVCDALDIDAAYVRIGLRRWLDGQTPSGAGWLLRPLASPVPRESRPRRTDAPCHPARVVVVTKRIRSLRAAGPGDADGT